MNERIKLIRKYFCNDSNEDFAKKVGVKQNQASNWVNTDYKVGAIVINKIITAFPAINPTWLLTGEGEMLKPTSNGSHNINIKNMDNSNIGDIGSITYSSHAGIDTTDSQLELLKLENRMLRSENLRLAEQLDKQAQRIEYLTDKLLEQLK
jgi:hypothetical protein